MANTEKKRKKTFMERSYDPKWYNIGLIKTVSYIYFIKLSNGFGKTKKVNIHVNIQLMIPTLKCLEQSSYNKVLVNLKSTPEARKWLDIYFFRGFHYSTNLVTLLNLNFLWSFKLLSVR